MRLVIEDTQRTVNLCQPYRRRPEVEYSPLYNPRLLDSHEAPAQLDGAALAYAFPIDRRGETDDLDSLQTMSHVGSGMRIYLFRDYFTLSPAERSLTREFTHKVLATEDYAYEAGPCQALAADPAKVIRNADNYALFLLAC